MKRVWLFGILLGLAWLGVSLWTGRKEPAPAGGKLVQAAITVFVIFFGLLYVISSW